MFSQRRRIGTSRLSLLQRSLGESTVITATEQSSDSAAGLIGPYGLNLLYAPSVPHVDFIFVHGLRGGSRKTWSKSDDPLSYWPKEWLPRDPAFENVRIFSFGYNSDWGERKDSMLNIHDFGKSLLADIQNSPQIMRDGDTPLVFIGHSMGGLIIKQTYILANQDPSAQSVAGRLHAMVFLATPHRGSDLAKILGNILKASMLHGRKPFVADLEQDSVMISLLNDGFRHYSTGLTLFSFYETLETNLGFSSALIVSKESAILGYSNEESALLNATHRSICKFDTPQDSNYISLRNVLTKITEKVTQKETDAKREQLRSDLLNIRTYLGVTELPEDDLRGLEDSKLDGSCLWFSEKEQFLTWRDSRAGTLPYYWLSAQQATGKSIMAAHVIRNLETANYHCSYYFFKHNDKMKIGLSGCLRSLAYQMAVADLRILRRLMVLQKEDARFNMESELAVWRKIFINGILEVPLDRPHFWVIDGLDECNNQNSFGYLLGKVSNAFPLRVFIASRPSSEIFRSFEKIKDSMYVDEMTANDTRCDIEKYIQACIKNFSLQDGDLRHRIADTVLQKSNGSFLWVALVLEEMRSAYSVANIEHILKDVPPGMDSLYERALSQLSRTARASAKHLAKLILTWTVCAIRPLTLKELEHALLLELGEEVLSLEKFIASTCWQFVQVDKSSLVSLIHETVKVFLLRKDLKSEFAIDPTKGHSRIADICLLYLSSKEMRPPRNLRLMHLYQSRVLQRSPFTNYACEFFTQHLRRSDSKDTVRFSNLCNFLAGNILSWVEHIARSGNLQPLIQAARDLKSFLDAQANYHYLTGENKKLANAWESDLAHLVSQFGRDLIETPSAIFWLIPPFCPPGTAIASQYKSCSSKISVKGLISQVWGDRMSCIQYRNSQARAVACGDTTFAIGLSDKLIKIYSSSTYQEQRQFSTSEPIKLLVYSDSGKILAVTSFHFLTLFKWDSGQQMWQLRLPQECLKIAFADQDKIIWIFMKGGILSSLSVADGSKLTSELLNDPFDREAEVGFRRVFTTAAFSFELNMVAVAQRGRPIGLYNMNGGTFLGALHRNIVAIEQDDYPLMWIRDFVFQPNSESSYLAVLYHDGQLVSFDPCELNTRIVVRADAHVLACSPDGHTLATGNNTGTIQIFDFESLAMIYKLVAFDYSIRSLAFSNDGLKFVDIRGSQCNVWEPSALIRETSGENDSSVSSARTVTSIVSVENEVDITALACHADGTCVACGKENGAVTLYSTHDGMEIGVLYNHAPGVAINFVIFGSSSDLIVSADTSSRCMVWRLGKSDNTWSAEGPLLDIRVQDYSIGQILLDSTDKRLLVSTIASDTIYDIETGHRESSSLLDRNSWKWIGHPRDPRRLIYLTASTAQVHAWDDVSETQFSTEMILAMDMSEKIYLKDAALCSDGSKVSIEFAKSNSQRSTSKVLIIESSSFEEPFANLIKPLALFNKVSAQIEYIIGSLGKTLFFLDRRMWVCSLDLEKFNGEYFRHFFIPQDWMSVNRSLLLRVTRMGHFIFIKKHEVAVIENGLENKEAVNIGTI